MKINLRFLVYNAYGIGGTIKTIFNFANFFYQLGSYNIEVISIKRTNEIPILYLNPKIKITTIQDSRRGAKYTDEERELLSNISELIHPEEDLFNMFNAYTDIKLKRILTELNDGILVTTMPSFNALSAMLVDKKVLKIGQEHKSFSDHKVGIQKMIIEKYSMLDAITVLTEKNKSVYQMKLKNLVNIFVLGNGTEKCNFRAMLKNHVILAAGRYSEEKGYNMLIQAFSKISKKFPDWSVKIYGQGELSAYYIDLIKENNLENQVFLEPATNKLIEKLTESSIHVCSSYREGFGMVIIEGFSVGVPCISFACDGPNEVITDGFDGILVPKEDVDALSVAMEKLMVDDNLRMEFGKNAFISSEKFLIEKLGEKFDTIIKNEILNKSKKDVAINNYDNTKYNVLKQNSQVIEINQYEKIENMASEGNLGIKIIINAFLGWAKYKVKKIFMNDHVRKRENNV